MLLNDMKLPLEMPRIPIGSPSDLYTVSMLPSFTVPNPPLRPTKEVRVANVPSMPVSSGTVCSSCQTALRPPPSSSVPRKPMRELAASTELRLLRLRPVTCTARSLRPVVPAGVAPLLLITAKLG